jgi:DNA replication and repair protein RecF
VHVTDASVGAQLAYWDDELVRFGALIYAYRIRTVRALSDLLTSRFAALTDGRDIRLTYLSNLTDARSVASSTGMSLEELAGIFGRDYSSQVAEARRDEVRRGVTLVGPHRDDLAFIIDGVDLASFGSRGEQRLAVVALKLAEADLMRLEAEEPPILMLDDVLSELYESHRDHLVLALSELDGQLLVTATGRDLLRHPALVELPEAHVRAGTVEGVV